MKRKRRYSAGEVRFRASKADLTRIEWLLEHHPDESSNTSQLLRILILREYERLQPKVLS